MSNKDIIIVNAIQFWTSSVHAILAKNKMHVDLVRYVKIKKKDKKTHITCIGFLFE